MKIKQVKKTELNKIKIIQVKSSKVKWRISKRKEENKKSISKSVKINSNN